MRVILLGAPGSGKGTLAGILNKKLEIPHISSGDIFRENIKNETKLGKIVKSYIDNGQLVPDEVTIDLIKERLKKDDCKNGFILDGYPRTIQQAQSLDMLLTNEGTKIDVVVNISVSNNEIVKRITGRRVCMSCKAIYHIKNMNCKEDEICNKCKCKLIQRDDDKEETVIKRLSVYRTYTKPLEEYYEQKGVLRAVDGNLSPETVGINTINMLKY